MTKALQNLAVRVDNLCCYSTTPETKRYRSKVLNKTFVFQRSKVVEYIDLSTGEILDTQQAKALGVKEYDYAPLSLERDEILMTLRREVREFASFLLRFRNYEGGVSPSVEGVVKYYSLYMNKHIKHVNRYLEQLKGKVLHTKDKLAKPFARLDKERTISDLYGQDAKAENTFLFMMLRKYHLHGEN